jgi:hypothetical protein
MLSCHLCGASIPSGMGVRRKLRTGTNVSGMAFNSRPVIDWTINSIVRGRPVGIRNSYCVRTVCASRRCAELVQIERGHKKLGGIFASAAARGSCLRPVLQCKNLRFHRGL